MRRSELVVLLPVEPEDYSRALDQNRPANQVRVLHHQVDRFLLRLRQRALFPHRAARAHVVEEAPRVDVFLEELARRRLLVDVHLADVHAGRVQKTSGVLARGSGGLPEERRFRHASRIVKVLTVNEIFHSIQGESTHAGRPCVFVRLTACDLRCSWCDTPYAFHDGRKMTIDEVVAAVDRHGCPLVEITGGEPLLQDDVYPLMERLLAEGRTVMLETGGHRPIARVPRDVVKIVDVKCPGSGEADRNEWRNLDALAPHDEVKFVVKDRADYEYARDVIARYGRASRAAAETIPSTYVPARNTIFLSLAVGWAEVLGAHDIVIGVNALDYSGYPDCRPEFIAAFERVANLGTRDGVEGARFRIHTPLISLGKADIIRRGAELGLDYGLTHSCYDPQANGRPCGACDSCRLGAKGFREAGMPDPLLLR